MRTLSRTPLTSNEAVVLRITTVTEHKIREKMCFGIKTKCCLRRTYQQMVNVNVYYSLECIH
jgi:hypothetical protein